MKRLLLDTHVLLWWLADDTRLGVKTRDIIAEPRNEIMISAATSWEISIKIALGKLQAPDDMERIVEEEGFDTLAINFYHGQLAGSLPNFHRDHFDRMLVAQAQAEGLILVTGDDNIIKYPVRTWDATT